MMESLDTDEVNEEVKSDKVDVGETSSRKIGGMDGKQGKGRRLMDERLEELE